MTSGPTNDPPNGLTAASDQPREATATRITEENWMTRLQVRRGLLAAVLVVAFASVAACGSSSGDSSGGDGKSGDTFDAKAIGISTLDELFKSNESAPPSEAPKVPAHKVVYYINCGAGEVNCANKAAAGKEAIEALGWEYHMIDGNYGIAGAYSDAIRTAVAAGADAIIADAFPCSDVQQAVQEAVNAGVLVVGADTLDCTANGGPHLYTNMEYNTDGPTPEDHWRGFGKYSAQYLINATGGHAKIINSPGQNTQQQLLDQGFLDEIKKCSGCEIVDTLKWNTADFVPNGPWTTAFRAALVQHPDATAVYVPFDGMATNLGGAQAIREAGKTICTGTPPFDNSCMVAVGGLGTADTLDLIREGQWTGVGSGYDGRWVAWGAVDTLIRAFDKEPAVPEGIGFTSIDKAHNLPSEKGSGFATSYDFKSAYLKAWGVSS
jgi:ribose transport system substrate-binding protein